MRKSILFCLALLLLLTTACAESIPRPTTDGQPSSGTGPADAEGPTGETAGEPSAAPTGEPGREPSGMSGGPMPQPEEPSVACPSVNGALRVEGTRLVDETGTPVQLRGVSTHGLAWYPDYVNLDCFRLLREEWNVNVIRLAMYTAEYGGYCSGGDQEALKALIDRGVRYAAEADMYVIIDWHILSDGNPNQYREEALAFFDAMSARYAGMDHVLYEICNEPNGGTTWQDVKSYAQEVIGRIRQNDPDAVILVGTPNWSQYVDLAAADPILGFDNIMYTLHFYAASHKEELRSRMTAAVESGLPVFVSEYGICDASGGGSIDTRQADAWADLLDRYGISYVAWNLSNKNESSSILRPECGKVSGFTAGDLSASGQWLYGRLTGAKPAGTDPGESAPPESTEPPRDASDSKTDPLEITLTVVNSWSADNGDYRQYSLTLKNTSDEALDGWTVTIPFEGAFALSDGWNGVFSVQGTDLVIASADYNGRIEAGGIVTDIGFIVRMP